MKRITLILFVLICGSSFAQTSATAGVQAQIVETLKIISGSDMNFGSIDAAGGGKVRVDTQGNRTFSNNDMKIISATAPTAASFEVTAADGFSYSISIPAITLTETISSSTMDVSFTHDVDGDIDGNATGTGAAQTLYVGGLLDVASGQTAGVYKGDVEVTVSYE